MVGDRLRPLSLFSSLARPSKVSSVTSTGSPPVAMVLPLLLAGKDHRAAVKSAGDALGAGLEAAAVAEQIDCQQSVVGEPGAAGLVEGEVSSTPARPLLSKPSTRMVSNFRPSSSMYCAPSPITTRSRSGSSGSLKCRRATISTCGSISTTVIFVAGSLW